MRIRDIFLLGLRAILAHRLRSFLTLLGIAVGIASVILLTSIGEGIHRFVLAEFTQFGSNLISITPGRVKTSGPAPAGFPSSVRPLTLEDVRAIQTLPEVIAVSPIVWGNTEVKGNGRLRRTSVYGVTPSVYRVYQMAIKYGAFLPHEENENARALAVLGTKLKDELFGTANPLGARLMVGNQQFRVIGVLENKGQFLGIDLDDVIFIPAARALELYNLDGAMKIDLSYREGTPVKAISQSVIDRLKARHGREDFTLTSQEEMLQSLSNILDVLTMAVGALGSISLLVGAVGIVTIMTIAVTERTSEIGLLVALGARRGTVLWVFLGEAVALSGLGGLAGLILGMGIAQLVGFFLPSLPVSTPFSFIILAELISILIGLIAGVMPARRAARLDPVEALRTE